MAIPAQFMVEEVSPSYWRVTFENGPVNLIDEGIDAALRIAHLPDSSMIAVRVGDVRRVIAAAPSYLAKHPRIDEPGDLAKQQIIAMNNSGVGGWSFPSVDAPFQARENVGIVVAHGRMLSSVRPSMRQEHSRRPVWEFADRVQITQACSKHCGKPWLSQPRLADCCAILSFRSPLRRRDRSQPTPPRPELCRCRL